MNVISEKHQRRETVMANLLVAKEYMKNFYSKYEIYLVPVLKLLLTYIVISTINGKLGYMEQLDNFSIVIMISLLCSFMPISFILMIAAMFITLHFYAIAIECAVVALGIFLVMFLLYFRFTPKEAICVLITPILFIMKIPYVMPIAVGLLGGPLSIIAVGCGIISYYMIKFVGDNINVLSATDSENAVGRFQFIIDGLLENKEMFIVVSAFSITVLLVYFIRRMSINHSWMIAIVSGALVNIFILFIGDFMLDLKFSVVTIILGTLVSVFICRVIEFFMFNLDYSRTEVVQFEDDEYYYYVKAVPKISLATPEKTVKKISTQKKEQGARVVRTFHATNANAKTAVKARQKKSSK